MDTQTIDQTTSEVQLHRVLWLIKLLRAMVLHVLLALVAALAFFLFLFDSGVRTAEDWETLARTVVPLLENAGVAPPGFEFQSRPIGFFFQNGRIVEIVNTNRTATSYRTAFSHCFWQSRSAVKNTQQPHHDRLVNHVHEQTMPSEPGQPFW
jgi:hypothetical protein